MAEIGRVGSLQLQTSSQTSCQPFSEDTIIQFIGVLPISLIAKHHSSATQATCSATQQAQGQSPQTVPLSDHSHPSSAFPRTTGYKFTNHGTTNQCYCFLTREMMNIGRHHEKIINREDRLGWGHSRWAVMKGKMEKRMSDKIGEVKQKRML